MPLPSLCAGARVDAIESVKQARQMLGGNRRTGVSTTGALSRFRSTGWSPPAGRRVADRIRQQVADCPPQHQRIARHRQATDKAAPPLSLPPTPRKLKHLMHFLGQIQRLLLRDQLVIIRWARNNISLTIRDIRENSSRLEYNTSSSSCWLRLWLKAISVCVTVLVIGVRISWAISAEKLDWRVKTSSCAPAYG